MNHIFRKQMVRVASCICLLMLVISLFWLGEKPEWVGLFLINPPADKFVHLIVFGFITALLWFSVLHPQPWAIFAITAMAGAADELHQYYIPSRTSSFADFVADLIGIMLTIAFLRDTQRRSAALKLIS